MIGTQKILNLVFFIMMIGINALANLLPLGIGSTGAISNKYPNLFTPAPITFSIWGVIYILVGVFVIYQLGAFGDPTYAQRLTALIGPWFVISCIMNICWLFSWHYDTIWLSVIFIICLLISLIILNTKINPIAIANYDDYNPKAGLKQLGDDITVFVDPKKLPFIIKLSIIGFDIYLGWICVATIANISVFLKKIKWSGFGISEQIWTLVILLVVALLGVLFIANKEKYFSSAAIAWACCGILIKHISQAGYAGKYPLVITVTIISIVIILSSGAIELLMIKGVRK